MSFLSEFKAFALKGNMVDLAVGIIIGAAYSKMINSLVSDIIMPPIGMLIGGVDFSKFSVKMHWPGSAAPPVDWKYGLFLNNVLELLIVSASIFIIIKLMMMLKREKAIEKTKHIEQCPECRMDIPKEARKCGHCSSVLRESEHDRIW